MRGRDGAASSAGSNSSCVSQKKQQGMPAAEKTDGAHEGGTILRSIRVAVSPNIGTRQAHDARMDVEDHLPVRVDRGRGESALRDQMTPAEDVRPAPAAHAADRRIPVGLQLGGELSERHRLPAALDYASLRAAPTGAMEIQGAHQTRPPRSQPAGDTLQPERGVSRQDREAPLQEIVVEKRGTVQKPRPET